MWFPSLISFLFTTSYQCILDTFSFQFKASVILTWSNFLLHTCTPDTNCSLFLSSTRFRNKCNSSCFWGTSEWISFLLDIELSTKIRIEYLSSWKDTNSSFRLSLPGFYEGNVEGLFSLDGLNNDLIKFIFFSVRRLHLKVQK